MLNIIYIIIYETYKHINTYIYFKIKKKKKILIKKKKN